MATRFGVFPQYRTQDRFALLLELLWRLASYPRQAGNKIRQERIVFLLHRRHPMLVIRR